MIHVYEVLRVVKFIDGRWNNGCQGLGGEGRLLFSGREFQFAMLRKFLRYISGDDYTTSECLETVENG